MTQTSTWLGKDGLMKTHGFCTFNITKMLTKGKWKMTVNTDITTKYIKVSLSYNNGQIECLFILVIASYVEI